MTPTQIYEDMLQRCWEVDTLEREMGHEVDGAGLGHMLLSASGHILAIEVGIDDSGRGFASVRVYDPDGELVEPAVFHVDGSVLAVTPS